MENEIVVPRSLVSHQRIGAIVTITAKEGREYRGRVVGLEGENARVRVFDELTMPSESSLKISLIQALPKKERMESIIRKATELGVTEILPCVSERSVCGKGEEGSQDKSHRWPLVAGKAVEQCRRRKAPVVFQLMELREAFLRASEQSGAKLILFEKEQCLTLRTFLSSASLPGRVFIACGPEGGFTGEEIAYARLHGFSPVRMGGRILRCETATVAALSIVQFVWGDL
jgi:16S rRNA (uracil1498-N3)-methyltransferase